MNAEDSTDRTYLIELHKENVNAHQFLLYAICFEIYIQSVYKSIAYIVKRQAQWTQKIRPARRQARHSKPSPAAVTSHFLEFTAPVTRNSLSNAPCPLGRVGWTQAASQ